VAHGCGVSLDSAATALIKDEGQALLPRLYHTRLRKRIVGCRDNLVPVAVEIRAVERILARPVQHRRSIVSDASICDLPRS
jgi:hypothetical protein